MVRHLDKMRLERRAFFKKLAHSKTGRVEEMRRIAVLCLQERYDREYLAARLHDPDEFAGAFERIVDVLEDGDRNGGVKGVVLKRQILADRQNICRRIVIDLHVDHVLARPPAQTRARIENEFVLAQIGDEIDDNFSIAVRRDGVGLVDHVRRDRPIGRQRARRPAARQSVCRPSQMARDEGCLLRAIAHDVGIHRQRFRIDLHDESADVFAVANEIDLQFLGGQVDFLGKRRKVDKE